MFDRFKETEIGPIPVDWDVMPLGEVADKPQYGYTASASEYPVGPKFLRITDIQKGKVSWASVPTCDIDEQSLIKYELEAGDLLFARIGATTGKTYLVTQCPPAVFASYLIRVRVKSRNLLPEYAYYFTSTEAYWKQINASKGGRLKKGINIPVLNSLLLPFPSLPEQRRIAHVLSTIKRAITAQDDLIAAARETKRSLMHRLFTYGPGPEPAPTKETEIGEIPEHWDVTRLGGMAEFKNGINFKSDQKGRGVLTVDVLNMYAGGITVQMNNLYRVDVDLKEHYLLQPDDILLVRSSLKQEGVGWPALFSGYTEPVTFCGFLIRARLTSSVVLSEFLVNYLRLPSVRQSLVSKSGKVAITNINQGNLKSLRVCLPPVQEQEEIVNTLQTVGDKITAEEQRKAALETLFQSTLQQLMTGRIRV